MDFKAKKYLHIHDWNYWWGYYRCGKDWEPFHAAEFSLAEDEAGEAPFFHFDFHNLPALHQTIRDGEFVEPDTPRPRWCCKPRASAGFRIRQKADCIQVACLFFHQAVRED